MNSSISLFSKALLDYFNGDYTSTIVVRRDDGWEAALPVSVFYRDPDSFSPVEQKALSLCRGNILDTGAGAGIHSLYLQLAGLSVIAIDISAEACRIMARRGVKDARCVDFFRLEHVQADTILFLGHGLGIAGTLSGLDPFLKRAQSLLKPKGQLLIHSIDVSCTDDPLHLAYHEKNRLSGKYMGEMKMQFEYKGAKGEWYDWLHVDPGTLTEHASQEGWKCEIILKEKEGDYLACLTLKE